MPTKKEIMFAGINSRMGVIMKRRKRAVIYKVKSKFKKNPDLLLKYGFSIGNIEGEEDNIFACPITIKEVSCVFKILKRALEAIYTEATTEERKKDFKNYEFKEILTEKQERGYELVLTDELRKEFTELYLCFVDRGVDSWILFINTNAAVFYAAQTLYECVPELITWLLKEGVIYKTKTR